jgi:hypothetical protein
VDSIAHPDWTAFGWHFLVNTAVMLILGLIAFWYYDLTHQTEAARMVGGPPRFRRAVLVSQAPTFCMLVPAMSFVSLYAGKYGLVAGVVAAIVFAAIIGGGVLALRRYNHKYRALLNDFINANRARGGAATWTRES